MWVQASIGVFLELQEQLVVHVCRQVPVQHLCNSWVVYGLHKSQTFLTISIGDHSYGNGSSPPLVLDFTKEVWPGIFDPSGQRAFCRGRHEIHELFRWFMSDFGWSFFHFSACRSFLVLPFSRGLHSFAFLNVLCGFVSIGLPDLLHLLRHLVIWQRRLSLKPSSSQKLKLHWPIHRRPLGCGSVVVHARRRLAAPVSDVIPAKEFSRLSVFRPMIKCPRSFFSSQGWP